MSDAHNDALANYEHTKRTAQVPAGWMIVEPQDVDPTSAVMKYWTPVDQCWVDLVLTANGAPAEFNTLFAGGATCIIVRDPNYVAPAPMQVPSFGGLPFQAPAPMPAAFGAPVAAPVPAAPAPIAPVATVQPVATSAPIIPVVVPSVPVAPVVVQTIPSIPAIAQALVPEAAPVLPQVTAPAFVPAPLAAVEEASDDETVAESSADPNEVSAWLAARDGVTAQIKALQAVEAELRRKIVSTCFPDGLREGANKCALPDGRKLTITGVVNRTVDDALVQSALEAMQKHFGSVPAGLFRSKYEVGLTALRALPADQKALLANVITEKNGTPQLKVSETK